MAKQTKEGWKCSICGKIYNRDIMAVSCEKGHDLITIQIKRDDLFRLVQFLYTRDEELLSESLIKTLTKYSKQMKGV